MSTLTVAKVLTRNDLALTGSHQAGILIPKHAGILEFFPYLDPATFNPRSKIVVHEFDSERTWEFNFIYYNNKFWQGTRNEYRLTGMTRYLRNIRAETGDLLEFSKNTVDKMYLDIKRGSQGDDLGGVSEITEITEIIAGEWIITSSRKNNVEGGKI